MEMEMMDEVSAAEAGAGATGLLATVERFVAAAITLEQAVEKLLGQTGDVVLAGGGGVQQIVAAVESDLERRLGDAESAIAALRATGASVPAAGTDAGSNAQGRKTLPVAMVSLLAKQGVTVDSVEAGALDAALTSLSIEQRIAVKAQLMRAGLLG